MSIITVDFFWRIPQDRVLRIPPAAIAYATMRSYCTHLSSEPKRNNKKEYDESESTYDVRLVEVTLSALGDSPPPMPWDIENPTQNDPVPPLPVHDRKDNFTPPPPSSAGKVRVPSKLEMDKVCGNKKQKI